MSDYDADMRRNGPQESRSPHHATSPPSWLPNTGVAKYGSQARPSLSDHGQQYGSSYRTNSNVGANSDYAQSSDGGTGSRFIGSEDGVNSDVQDRHSDFSIGMLPGEVNSRERLPSKSPRGYDPRIIRSEEKKDDEAQEEPKTSFSLKDKWRKWESKQANASLSSPSPAPQEPSRVSASSLSQLQKTLGGELLTPDIVESRRQAARKMRAEDLRNSTVSNSMLAPDALRRPTKAVPVKEERTNECYEQRNSFASFRDRLKASPHSREDATAKSESGAAFRTSSVADKVLSRISPRNGEVVNNVSVSFRDTQSDTGSTPSFLASVKLRKTRGVYDPSREDLHQNYSTDVEAEKDYASPRTQNERSTSYREQRPWEHQNTQEDEYSYSPTGPEDEPEAEPEKKLTYRERRELELKQEQQEKAKKETPKTVPKRDVASLIRRRIAANKAKEEGVKSSEQGDEGFGGVSPYRGMLKPSRMPNKGNEDIGPVSSYDTESNSLYSVGSVSPRRTPLPVSHETRDAHGNAHHTTHLREHFNFHGQSGRQEVHKMISPTSADSEMNYSSSVHTADGGNNGGSRAGPELRSPRAVAEKPTPRALQQLQKKGSFSGSPRIETPETTATSHTSEDQKVGELDVSPRNPDEVKAMLVNFLGGKSSKEAEVSREDAAHTLMRSREPRPVKTETPFHEAVQTNENSESMPKSSSNDGRPALKDDPKYERYFRMLKVGMPMDVVKHAMTKDGNDPSVMDGDHNSPVGLALKDDPKYEKYFKMLKFGIKMDQVKHAMERDGLDEPKEKPTHRRARLHWKTLQKVRSNSLWAKLEQDQMLNEIDIDEKEFRELFQADLAPVVTPKGLGVNRKRGAAVRVIDAKRANNGGIILARLKMTHDDMADAVDRMYVFSGTSLQLTLLLAAHFFFACCTQ
jgi:hypothetical protein